MADLRLQRLRRPLGDDPAAVDDPDVVGELVGLLQVLGGEEDGRALVVQRPHLLPDRLAADRVEAGGRLVEEEDAGLVDQRRGEVEAALHPARVAADPAVGRRGQVDPLEQIVGAPLALLGGDALQGRLQADQLAAGHQRVERRFLQGDADRAPHRPSLLDHVVPGDGGAARRSAAAASSASARSSSCPPRWGRGSRRFRPPAPRGRCPAPRAPRRRRAPAPRRRLPASGLGRLCLGDRRKRLHPAPSVRPLQRLGGVEQQLVATPGGLQLQADRQPFGKPDRDARSRGSRSGWRARRRARWPGRR